MPAVPRKRCALRTDLERQRRDHAARGEEGKRCLAALRRGWEAERQRWLDLLAAAGPQTAPGGPAPTPTIDADARPPRPRGAATRLHARPQACSYRDPETFRAHVEQWLAEAQDRLEDRDEEHGQARRPASAAWVEYEIRTAREEIALLDSSQVSRPDDALERPAGRLEHV